MWQNSPKRTCWRCRRLTSSARAAATWATARVTPVKEVVETAWRVTGHPIPAVVGPRRPGDPAVLVASSERIRHELGWVPQYPDLEFMFIIRSARAWHRAQPNGYE